MSDLPAYVRPAGQTHEEPGALLDVLVSPRASRTKLGEPHDGYLKLAITSPPVEGEANAAVIKFMSKALVVSRSSVTLVAGAQSRRKTLHIDTLSAAQVALRLMP